MAALNDRKSLCAEIVRVFVSPQCAFEAEFHKLIEAQAGPIYGTAPNHPGKIVERRPDGTEAIGTLRGRQFIADEPPARALGKAN
jgi:hypothetical protein